MNEITNFVNTVGFPIASYLISALFIKYTYDKQIKREESHDKDCKEHWAKLTDLTKAVNENSQALRELVALMTKDNENKIL